ncbi:hypothetical protein, partial [Aeromonas enteropelogenes]|uniref:hypothetical protein n=1 Tax=Aeromonas enteropelogenes TaxID=29489 RepID=UPI003BA381C4
GSAGRGIFYFQIARKLIEVGLEEASRVVKQDGRLTFRYRPIKGNAHIEETDKFGQLNFSNNADNPIYRHWHYGSR